MLRASFMLLSVLTCLANVAQAQSMAPLRLGVALGSSFGEGAWWWPDGGHAALSLTSQAAGSRFGLRLETMVDHNTSGARGADGSRTTWQHATLGLTINTTYRLMGARTGLYAIGGVGVYHRWTERRIAAGFAEEVRNFRGAAIDANLGLGFDFTAFGRDMFVESRLHGGAFHKRVPLTLGIRF